MALQFREVTFPLPTGTGARFLETTVTFGTNVRTANVALNGFKLDYASADHHINIMEANVGLVSISGRAVRFHFSANYADKNFDDSYTGFVTALVIADVD